MINIENYIPFILIVTLIVIYLAIRFIIRTIRVSRITKNSLKEEKKSLKINNNQIKNETYTQKELDNAIVNLLQKINQKSIELAISDIVQSLPKSLGREFENIQNEIKLGINPSKAFERLYKKTNNQKVLALTQLLYLYDNQKISKEDIIDYFNKEKEINENDKIKMKKYTDNNLLTAKILSVISLSIITIIFVLSIEQSGNIGLIKWIEFLIIVILTYLIYFEINDFYTASDYKRVQAIKQEQKIINYLKLLNKNKIPFNASFKLLKNIIGNGITDAQTIQYQEIWNKLANKEEAIKKQYEIKIEKEMQKIPYKLGINWTICTTIVIITILYLTK